MGANRYTCITDVKDRHCNSCLKLSKVRPLVDLDDDHATCSGLLLATSQLGRVFYYLPLAK